MQQPTYPWQKRFADPDILAELKRVRQVNDALVSAIFKIVQQCGSGAHASEEMREIAKKAIANYVSPITPPTEVDFLKNGRLQGIACALGELADAHMEPDLANLVMESLGLTITALKAAGADPFDLERLMKKPKH